MTLVSLWVIRRTLEAMEEKGKVPCERCATPFPKCGPHCPQCNQPRAQVFAVGLLGSIKKTLAPDLAEHGRRLLARKRCSTCGERLRERKLRQVCSACHTAPFADQAAVARYLAEIKRQLPMVLGVLFLIGFVPLLGLVVGIIYYRVSIVSSLRCYLPRTTGVMARWGVRVINIVILCFQPVPILGAVTLPLMCLTNYWVYSSLLQRQSLRTLSQTAVPPVPQFHPQG